MPTSCSVIGCKSRMNAGPKKQFFRFPLNRPKVLQQWLMVLDRLDWVPKPSSKICNEHFASEDYIFRPNGSTPRLKPEAVPSIFPDPDTTVEEPIDETKDINQLLTNEESPSQNQENLDENSINANTKHSEKGKPLVSDDLYSKRPRRTSKINVKMKDFILLDDMKKLTKPVSIDSPKAKLLEKEDYSVKIKSSEKLEGYKPKLIEKLDPSKLNDAPPKSNLNSEVSKVDAAKELLSILEDSDDDLNVSSENENSHLKSGNIVDSENSSSEVLSTENRFQPVLKTYQVKKDSSKTNRKPQASVKSQVKTQSTVRIAEIASKVKAASCVRVNSGKLHDHKSETVQPVDSKTAKQTGNLAETIFPDKNVFTKLAQHTKSILQDKTSDNFSSELNHEKAAELIGIANSSDIKIPRHIRTKRPSTDLAKTYFPIRCGENFFYFSYADLNPIVDLSKNNVLMREVSQNILKENIGSNELSTNKTKPQMVKNSLKRKNEDLKTIKKHKNNDQLETNAVNSSETENEIEARSDVSKISELNENDGIESASSQENNITFNDQEILSENSMDNQQPTDTLELETVEMVSTPPKKRKKRFKTVAEIVVRTDNAKPGEVPNVSIDKINKLVDFKAAKSSAIKTLVRRGKSNRDAASTVDVNDNLNHITITNDEEPSEEELSRLSERITDTVKKMKLLDKVKGNSSKLTVLITTLPPVKEKEILIIKKKNLETNTTQSRELQVVISSNKPNENSIHGNFVVSNPLGYTILPAGKINKSGIIDSNSKIADESGNSINPDVEHATIVCFQDKSGNKETSDKDFSSIPNVVGTISTENLDFSNNESIITVESGDKEKNSSEAIKHDHPYISPNVKYVFASPTVSLNLAEIQSKESGLKLKLSENEVLFRNKVGKKLRTLKENIKKKNDSILKLKDKIKYLERSLKEVKRSKKNSAKAVKKDSNSLLQNDIFYGVDQLVDTSDFTSTMDYTLNNIELPLGLEENAEESEDDDGERECSSPITYLCEPAIEVPGKDREPAN